MNPSIISADSLIKQSLDFLYVYWQDETKLDAIEEAKALLGQISEIMLTPQNRIQYYSTYGTVLAIHGIRFHEKGEIDQAIELLSNAVAPPREINYYLCSDYYLLSLAYWHRFEYSDNKNDLVLAIEYQEGSLRIDTVNSPNYSLLGAMYRARWDVDHNLNDLNESIRLLDRAVAVYPSAMNYYNLGASYLSRWEQKPNPMDLNCAKNCLLKALKLEDNYFNTYYVLNTFYEKTGNKVESYACINTALYLLLSQRAAWQAHYFDIFSKIQPDQLYDSLEYLVSLESKKKLGIDEITPFFPKKDFLLLFQFMKMNPVEGSHTHPLAILMFYLGGVISSFIYFSNHLHADKEDILTPREYYYYARSSYEMYDYTGFIGADAILEKAIKTVSQNMALCEEDVYYLGQLYFLKALRTNQIDDYWNCIDTARRCFTRAGNHIWAKAMLDILSNQQGNKAEVLSYVKQNCNSIIVVDKTGADNLGISGPFNDYFHFNEVHYANPFYLSDENSSSPSLFFQPIWDIFKLSKTEYEKLAYELRKLVGLEIQKAKAEEESAASKPIELKEELALLKEIQVYKDLTDTKEVEAIAQTDISKQQLSFQEKDILLRYLFQNKKIDSDQYFTLLKYNEFCQRKKTEKTIRIKTGRALSSSFVVVIINLLTNSNILGGLTAGILSLYTLFGKEEPFDIDSYYSFKDALWVVLNNQFLSGVDPF